MWRNINFEACQSYLNCHLYSEGKGQPVRPTITISRMCGAGGRTVAAQLAEYLQLHAPAHCHWTIFDKNLVAKVLEDQHLPRQLAHFMAEKHKPMFSDALEEMFGLHPPTWELVQETSKTIWNLAQLGYVILVGRGANVITSRLKTALHVRLVGSLEKRIARVQEVYELDWQEAHDFIQTQDTGKKRYLKDYFDQNIDDPLLYHLIINTDRMTYEDAARLIGQTVISHFQLEHKTEPTPGEMSGKT